MCPKMLNVESVTKIEKKLMCKLKCIHNVK